MNLPLGFGAHLTQSFQEPLTVRIVVEDGLAAVAPIHHVINRARILHAQLAGHWATLRSPSGLSKQNHAMCGTDPFLTPFRERCGVGNPIVFEIAKGA